MLSLFPQLLFLTPLAVAVLRVCAGAVFLYLAWEHFTKRTELAQVSFIVVGRGMWIPLFAALVELAVAAALIVGIFTQVAALFGALLALKQLVWNKRYPQLFSLPRSTSFLLAVICLALVIAGAGALAIDLPL